MATTARSRGFMNRAMPLGSGEKFQQPMGYNGDSLYPDKSIWHSTTSNARLVSRDALDSDDGPSGSNKFATNSQADVWRPKQSSIWSSEHSRSVSTSPSRARDVAVGSIKNSGFGGSKQYQDDGSLFGQTLASKTRPTPEGSYMDSLVDSFAEYSQARDSSLPPSRQSQGSPAYQDLMRGHTPSNSIHSQRTMPSHAASYSSQSANQRAYNLNKQMDEDLSLHLSRRLALENANSNAAAFHSPTLEPFRFNPGSQPWLAEPRYGGGIESHHDAAAGQYNLLKRSSMDRGPSALDYRAYDSSSLLRNYNASPEEWSARALPLTATRGNRSNDDRRNNVQHLGGLPFYPNQLAYTGLPSQYTPGFFDIYGQGQALRPNLMPPYNGLSVPPAGYALTANLTPVHPLRDQDSGRGLRSVVLDEFRLSKSNKGWELKDIYGHVVEFSGDQHGSRFIQQKLETASGEEKDQVFREIEPNAVQLMKDVFGNYVIQKFFEHGNQVQKRVLADKIRAQAVDLSLQAYACRVVQKSLGHILIEQQVEIAQALEPDILGVIKDQQGNHVVQKIIQGIPRQYIEFIMQAVRGQVVSLASHLYGCRVIQRLLERGSEADKLDIMTELHASAQSLIMDQYGNYVAQHVIAGGKLEDRNRMIALVTAHVFTLSKHKFASNVVEKCIQCATPEQLTGIRQQLTAVSSDGTSHLQQMMRDQFGNYVIQKLLATLDGHERELLVEEVRPQFLAMRKHGASRQSQALEKFLGLTSSGLAKNDGIAGTTDSNSTSDTPALTNETSSPQSTSPSSAHASAVNISQTDDFKSHHDKMSRDVNPRVRQEA